MLLMFLASSSARAGEVSLKTKVSHTKFEIGEEFQIPILLNLSGALSTGGFIELTYDSTVLKCVQVINYNIFSQSEDFLLSCPDSDAIRITSTSPIFSDTQTFSSDETFALVTFQVVQASEATDIHLTKSSQIFGTTGGNILSIRDDGDTQGLLTFVPLIVMITFPDAGEVLSGDSYLIEWYIQNMLSSPIELTLEIRQTDGDTWEILSSITVESTGLYEWDLTGIADGEDYILSASIINDYKQEYVQSLPFAIARGSVSPSEPYLATPEPSTMILFALGVLGILWIRKTRV
jgi:predicted  nucleic acid-binding Zn-ribbon protein